MNNTTLALFFTTKGKSLENWDRIGILDREILLYVEAAAKLKKIYFFTYGTDDAQYQSQLPKNIIVVPRSRGIPVGMYSLLLPFIHRKILRTVDILKTNQMDGSWAAVLTKKLYGNKLIVRCGYEWLLFMRRANRSRLKRFFVRCVEKIAYRNADIVVQTSQEAARFIQKQFSISSQKIRVIPNYIATQLFTPITETKKTASVVYVGRLEPEKNVASLIESLAGLSVTLAIIGKGSQQQMLEALAKEKGISIHWVGIVSQTALPAELAKHEVFVLPSLHEGSPKTLLEAMSCGLPCVATDVQGSREVVHDGIDGLLCGTDPESLKTAIKQLLDDDSLRARLGLAARNTILTTYSFEKILEEELSVYTSLQ